MWASIYSDCDYERVFMLIWIYENRCREFRYLGIKRLKEFKMTKFLNAQKRAVSSSKWKQYKHVQCQYKEAIGKAKR